jgi:hypothetical protein
MSSAEERDTESAGIRIGYEPGAWGAVGRGGSGNRRVLPGFAPLAANILIVAGLGGVLSGISMLVAGTSYYVMLPTYSYHMSMGFWGWVHVISGIVAFATGVCIFLGAAWARTLGVVIASAAVVVNLLFLPFQPALCIVMIGLATLVIWALLHPRTRGLAHEEAAGGRP